MPGQEECEHGVFTRRDSPLLAECGNRALLSWLRAQFAGSRKLVPKQQWGVPPAPFGPAFPVRDADACLRGSAEGDTAEHGIFFR